jgi:hypothetical protein
LQTLRRIAAAGLAGRKVRMTAQRTGPKTPGEGAWVQRLLDEQLGLCRQLDELSLRQSALIDEGDYEALLELLAQREGVIASLTKGQQELDPVRLRWEAFLASLSDERAASVRERADQLSTVTARIAKRDQADQDKIKRNRDEASAQLKTVSRTRGALSAYTRRGDNVATFQDRSA